MNITRMPLAVTTGLLLAATAVAQPAPPAGRDIPVPLDRGNERLSDDNIGKAAVENAPKQPAVRPANTLPSDAASSNEDIVYTPEYLMEHTEELEKLLVELIRRNETAGLKLLLPIYAKVPNRDDSLIDWGNAIIAVEENRPGDAVKIGRAHV